MSGELHHLVLRQSLAGRLAVEDGDRQAAFLRGLGTAREAPIAALFAARSSVLLDRMAPEDVGDYLSGVLIGAEIAEAQRLGLVGSRVLLCGEATLLGRYKAACEVMLPDYVAEAVPMAATAGFQRIVHDLDRVAVHPTG
jgi:2-dehydro-3-deoxygalactonokinase